MLRKVFQGKLLKESLAAKQLLVTKIALGMLVPLMQLREASNSSEIALR